LSVTLFEKTPLLQALSNVNCQKLDANHGNQLKLFN
jgi:hypothetical protein